MNLADVRKKWNRDRNDRRLFRFLADLHHLSPRERKLLLAIGSAGRVLRTSEVFVRPSLFARSPEPKTWPHFEVAQLHTKLFTLSTSSYGVPVPTGTRYPSDPPGSHLPLSTTIQSAPANRQEPHEPPATAHPVFEAPGRPDASTIVVQAAAFRSSAVTPTREPAASDSESGWTRPLRHFTRRWIRGSKPHRAQATPTAVSPPPDSAPGAPPLRGDHAPPPNETRSGAIEGVSLERVDDPSIPGLAPTARE